MIFNREKNSSGANPQADCRSVMNDGNMRKWFRLFKEGTTNVHEAERSGRPFLVTDDLKGKANARIREKRRYAIYRLHGHFLDVSRPLIHETVMDWLKCLAATILDEDIQKQVARYDKCLNLRAEE
jgi:hypothetical protein